MRLLLHTSADPVHDLALEESLQLHLEEGLTPNTWRIWQAANPAVIIGTGQEAALEANLENAQHENIPVLRRHSGGGAVVIGPGVINYSAFYRFADLPGSETIRGAMLAGLKPVVETLQLFGMRVQDAGLSDLAVICADGSLKKFAGNSQARKKNTVVVHGTLLADPDWELIERVLNFPSKTPDYRAGRSHRAFLTSLREQNAPFSLAAFTEGLLNALPSDIVVKTEPEPVELERAAKLAAEKYGTAEWNFRR